MAITRAELRKKIDGTDALSAEELLAAIDWHNELAAPYSDERRILMEEVNELHAKLYNLASTPEAKDKLLAIAPVFFGDLDTLRAETTKLALSLQPITAPTPADLTDTAKLADITERFRKVWAIGYAANQGLLKLSQDLLTLHGQAPAVMDNIVEQGKAAAIKEYKAAQTEAKAKLDAATALTTLLTGDDKEIEANSSVIDAALPKFQRAQATLAARQGALTAFTKIEDAADSSDREKFATEEAREATAKLAADLADTQAALQTAIRNVKETKLKELQEKSRSAFVIARNAFTDTSRNVITHQKAATVGPLISSLKTQFTENTKRANDLLAPSSTAADRVTPDSTLKTIKAAEDEVTALITVLLKSVDLATAAYDAEFALKATLADIKTQRATFATAGQAAIDMADKILPTLKIPPVSAITSAPITITTLDGNLTAARGALDAYLKKYPVIDATNKDAFLAETDHRRLLLENVTKATGAVSEAIYQEIEVLRIAQFKAIETALNSHVASVDLFNSHDQAIKDQISDDQEQAAQDAHHALVFISNELKNPTLRPLTADGYSKALTDFQKKISGLNIATKITALANADSVIDTNLAAYQLQQDVQGLLGKIYTAFPTQAIWDAVDAAAKNPIDGYVTTLENFREQITFDPLSDNSILTLAELAALRTRVDAAVVNLDAAITTAKPEYKKHDDAAKTAAASAAASAATAAATKLQDDKDTLNAQINSAIGADSDASKLLASISATANKTLQPHDTEIGTLIKQLEALKVKIADAATTQPQLDDQTTGLRKQVADKITALATAAGNAHSVIDPIRAKHVQATFNSYVERVKRIEGAVDFVARGETSAAGTPDKYKETLEEINRMKGDLESYRDLIAKGKAKEENQAQEQIDKLNKIIKMLTTTANMGVRHFSTHSVKVDDLVVDPTGVAASTHGGEKQYEKNIAQAKKKVLENTEYSAATTAPGSGAFKSLSPAGKAMTDRFTAGFTQLAQYEGRVNLTETSQSKFFGGESKTVSLSTQRIKDGAHVTEIEFVEDKKTGKELFDSSTQRRMHSSGLTYVNHEFANDSVNEHAIIAVLNHVFADKSEDFRKNITDKLLKDFIEGIKNPALKQAAISQPIYITGSLHDTFALATMDFCNLIGVECHDTRNGKDCNLIKDKKMTENRGDAYRDLLIEKYKKSPTLQKTLPAVGTKAGAEYLAKHTKPPGLKA